MRIELQSSIDRAGFYRSLAQLLDQNTPWDQVEWQVSALPSDTAATLAAPQTLRRLPATFCDAMHVALLHSEPGRHALLHRIAQRLWQDPARWQDPLHDDHIRLQEWKRQVQRDMHKTKAFARFTRVGEGEPESEEDEYVAWFEPVHHTLVEVAPFFVRRFTQMRWSILSPSATLRWDGQRLRIGAGAQRHDAPPPDAGEALWLAYYARTFNPARVKIAAMKKEMPEVYWKNLPETRLIPGLLAQAPHRVGHMLASAADTQRRPPGPKTPNSLDIPTGSLAWISQAVQACDQCACAARATQAVMGVGPATARLFVVGEQPGDREDLSGQPFVGPSGQLLRAAFQEAGVDIQRIYVTNAVKHFSYEMRGKRRLHKTPSQADVERCAHWLEAELSAVKPAVVIALGRTALGAIEKLADFVPALSVPGPMDLPAHLPNTSTERGRWRGARVAAVAHPSALLRAGAAQGSAGYQRWVESLRLMLIGAPD